MKKKLSFLVALLMGYLTVSAQCTTTNATGCSCPDGISTNCDLLPDITLGEYGFWNELGGPSEYPQVCNPPCNGNDGRLRLTTSTPNIGHGPLTVGSVSIWVCDGDTLTSYPGTCPDGSAPQQLVKQKIYHKDGNVMTNWERWAGGMTYHPTHGHMHVDDWIVMTLRTQDPTKPDPRDWPIIGTGSKMGFCLMDYGSCNTYNGHCLDSLGNVLTAVDFPNYQLGGGQYNCSPVEQGISSGYTDIYHENLDGMWIDIPPGLCNGDYFVVVEVDKHNFFLEVRDDNNVMAIPITLTEQLSSGNASTTIDYSGASHLCAGEVATLVANTGGNPALSYQWSTGDTTPSIDVTASGQYYLTATSACGTAISDTITLDVEPNQGPVVPGADICGSGSVTLSTTATGTVNWYDAATGGNLVYSGNSYTTPTLTMSESYWVETEKLFPGGTAAGGPVDNTFGGGANHTNNTRYQIFDVMKPCTLVSVDVVAASTGNRTIALMDGTGAILDSVVVNIASTGLSTVTLNLPLTPGTNYRLGLTPSSTLVDLYRNNAGVVYPYAIGSFAEITGSSAGVDYYYWYYNWQVKEDDKICLSPRTQVDVVVNAAPSVSMSGLAPSYIANMPAVTLTGSPSGGTFSGPGVTGNTFSPAAAGPGGPYTITYSYTDANGCSGTATQTVEVVYGVGIDNESLLKDMHVFPNPNNGTFHLTFDVIQNAEVSVKVTNITGQVVWEEKEGELSGSFNKTITLDKAAAGVYFVEIRANDAFYRIKMVKE
ncbi:MAG: T9SS type A sorting domain-containing protein [Bacteroidia bacterium]|nr:T9SS type A sorting domain-containing protein [Bacteroidia bacterium]